MRRRLLKDSGVDWSKEYLTFIPTADATTFKYSIGDDNTLQYSLDNGVTWTTLYDDTDSPSVAVGQKIMWRGTKSKFNSYKYRVFKASNYFSACGNPLSIILSDQFIGVDDLTGKDCCFYHLFYNNQYIVDASNLYLGFTTLPSLCCDSMFYKCTSLITAPRILPATTLAYSCYDSMFYDCTSLTTAPELLATTLANLCCSAMFYNCKSLTTAPELPATTLATRCYSNMFSGCTSLITAPRILPATTLAYNCYDSMFWSCKSLTTAPELPATTLEYNCYRSMFSGCSNLNYIKAMFLTWPNSYDTANWVYGVASSGTFIKNSAADWDETGNNSVPSGWRVQTASE